MTRVALIPARAGSKRLPMKNVLPFAGRPMLAWTVEAALTSGLFDRVIVSSDGEAFLEAGLAAGAEAHRRAPALADDKASLVEVSRAFLAEDPDCAEFCLLLPNCPLRTAEDIVGAHAFFSTSSLPAVLSVVDFGWTPPFRALVETEDGLSFFMEQWKTKKSQAYPPVCCPTGAVYWARREALLDADSLYVPGLRGHAMPWHRGIDIDTATDFILAQAIRHCLDTGFSFETGTVA